MRPRAPFKRLLGVTAATTLALLAFSKSARAEDPLDSEGAPRYVISVESVKIDRTANWPSWFNVVEHQTSGTWGYTYSMQNWYSGQPIPTSPPAPLVPRFSTSFWEWEAFHGTGDIDFFAMSTGVYTNPAGLPKAGGAGMSCVIGQGDYGRYETYCQRDPVNNIYNWQPMKLPTPLSVAATETLKINYRLSVLNPTDQVGSASADVNAISMVGNSAAYAGALMAMNPALTAPAAWVSAGGVVLSIIGSLFSGDSRSIGAWGCTTHGSLIPGSDGQPMDFSQLSLSGADLYANTGNGDALFSFVHDYNAAELCGKPKTTITFRVHRVVTSSNPRAAQGGTTVNDYPRVSAFSMDKSGFAMHDEREVDGTFARRTRIPGNVCTTCIAIGGAPSNFKPDARVVGVSRYSGHLDAFAVDKNGALYAAWRDVNYASGAWQTWGQVSRNGQFPPSAPLAVLSVNKDALDILAIDPSGAILDIYWRSTTGWQGPVVAAPAGTASPYRTSSTWGSPSIVSLGELAATSPYGTAIDVVTLGTSGGIAHAGTNGDGAAWTSSPTVSPSGVSFVPGGPIAMLSRKWNGLDIVATDSSLVLRTLVFNGTWATTMPAITDSSKLVWYEAPIAITARKQNDTGDASSIDDFDHMDVVTVGLDGKLLHSTWEAGLNGNSWNPSWVETLAATADAFSSGATPPSRLGVVSPFASSIVVSTANPSDATVTWTWFDHALAPNWQGIPRN